MPGDTQLQRYRIESATEDPMHVRRVEDDTGSMVMHDDAVQAIATARQKERDGTRRLALAVEHVTRAVRKLLDDTDQDGRSFLVDRQNLEAAIAGAAADVADVLEPDEAPSIPTAPALFEHLEPGSTPQTSAEAFYMATQWATGKWSYWNRFAGSVPNPEAAAAQADAAEVQKLVALANGLLMRESVQPIVAGLGGIEDRLSEINGAVRD